jgi:hypothetical protein
MKLELKAYLSAQAPIKNHRQLGAFFNTTTMSSSEPSYTVFIRLPFPRRDFVDPPSVSHSLFPNPKLTFQVEWDPAKDKALWKILSKASKNSDIDCKYPRNPSEYLANTYRE